MTSIPINVGLGDGSKTSSKVLKPPGGGCSNIFGDPTPAEPAKPRAPKVAEAPKPTGVPKPAEAPKPTGVPKPAEAPATKPTEAPATKPAEPPKSAAAPKPSEASKSSDASKSSAEQAAGLRSERQKLFGPAETSSEVHKQSYNYRNQSSIVFGGVDSKNNAEPGKTATAHQPSIKIHNPPGGKSSGIF